MQAEVDIDLVLLFRCICSRIDVYNATTTDLQDEFTSGDDPPPSKDLAQNLTNWPVEDSDACASTGSSSASNDRFRYIEELLLTRVIVTICVLGLVGNVGNLLVLVPQGRHCSMGRIERSVHWGLTSLAVSDLFFCLTVIPRAFTDRDPVALEPGFSLLYAVYGDGLINVFILASTWLTVAMAVGRYLAVCHPFRAREMIGITVAKRAVFVIYGACVLCNAPRFFVHRVARFQCASAEFYFRWSGYVNVRTHPDLERGYMWGYFVVGILLPCALLSFSNAFLIRALQRANTQVRLNRTGSTPNPVEQYRPVTLTLVVLIIMYIVLVSPAEIAIFLRHRLVDDVTVDDDTYGLLAAVGNTLQAVNFSVNFVLYYVINVHFRRALFRLVRSRCRQMASPSNHSVVTGSLSLNPVQRHDREKLLMGKMKTAATTPEEV